MNLKITPRELRSRFLQAQKSDDETYTLFAARLQNNLMYYLCNRNASDNIDKLISFLVADKLKDCLSPSVLHYVLIIDGDQCFTPSKVASTADTYCSNYIDRGT